MSLDSVRDRAMSARCAFGRVKSPLDLKRCVPKACAPCSLPRIEYVIFLDRLAVQHAEDLASHAQHGHRHRHCHDGFAEPRHGTDLAADAAGKVLALDVEVERDAVELDRRVVGILHAQLDQQAQLHALARQRLDSGHCDLQRIVARHRRAADKRASQPGPGRRRGTGIAGGAWILSLSRVCTPRQSRAGSGGCPSRISRERVH